MARRQLEPTVFLAGISPITVALVAGTVALVLLLGGPWWLAALLAVVVWIVRLVIANRVASHVRALPRRIDPFALREPWRFFVRDALQARTRFTEIVEGVDEGPLRQRLVEIGDRITTGVDECWQVAQKGQGLTDARRSVDVDGVQRELEAAEGERRASLERRVESHDRLAAREDDTRQRLELLDTRLEEAVVRAIELSRRRGDVDRLDEIADAVDGVVGDLEALRLGLDEAEGTTS